MCPLTGGGPSSSCIFSGSACIFDSTPSVADRTGAYAADLFDDPWVWILNSGQQKGLEGQCFHRKHCQCLSTAKQF